MKYSIIHEDNDICLCDSGILFLWYEKNIFYVCLPTSIALCPIAQTILYHFLLASGYSKHFPSSALFTTSFWLNEKCSKIFYTIDSRTDLTHVEGWFCHLVSDDHQFIKFYIYLFIVSVIYDIMYHPTLPADQSHLTHCLSDVLQVCLIVSALDGIIVIVICKSGYCEFIVWKYTLISLGAFGLGVFIFTNSVSSPCQAFKKSCWLLILF